MLNLFTDLGFGISGLFLAVLLSGILAGVISYGFIEIISRRRIQHDETVQLIDKPLEQAFSIEGYGSVLERLRRRYRPEAPADSSDTILSVEHASDRRVARYVNRLRKALNGEKSLIPTLLGLPEPSLYRLHYRQFCGQIAAQINREAIEAGGDKLAPGAPVTDALSLIAPGWEKSLPPEKGTSWGPGSKRLDAFDRQAHSERAMSVVDLLQIRMSEAIARHALKFSAFITGLIFVTLVASGARHLDFTSSGDFIFSRLLGVAFAYLAALLIALLLACAACIIAILTFRVIDHVASPR